MIRPVLATAIALVGVPALEAQSHPPGGRVAGLSVSVLDQTLNGTGKDVTFQVDMTTVRPTSEVETAFNLHLFGFTADEATFTGSGTGGLGDLDVRRQWTASSSVGRIFDRFVYNGRRYSGDAFYHRSSVRTLMEGELPGLSFGDGATVNATTLLEYGTPFTTTPTGTPLLRSKWRGTFVHTYPDLGEYTVRAASRCCPVVDPAQNERGVVGELFSGNRVYPNNSSQQDLAWTFRSTIHYQNAVDTGPAGPVDPGTTGTTTATTSPRGASGTFMHFSARTLVASTWADPESPLGQVTNTARVPPGYSGSSVAVRVPTASTVGLSLLALVLGGIGVVALRSS